MTRPTSCLLDASPAIFHTRSSKSSFDRLKFFFLSISPFEATPLASWLAL